MEKHRKKDKYNLKKTKKFKVFILILLIISLILVLYKLDLDLRTSTSTKDQSICSLRLNEDTIDINLFGKKYYIDKETINKRFKNLKGTIKRLKDQSALVF